MKPVFLSVDRSLKFWRSDAPYYNGEVQTSPLECVSMDGCARSIRDIEAYSSVLDGSEEPVEVLVPSKAYCSKTSLLATRVIEFPLPPYSFCRASGNVYVCAPTLLFLLAASRYSLHKLIAVGLELCGTYSPRDGMPSKSDHDAICDVQTLRDYVASITGNVRGIQLARRALQYIEDGSASPRETDAYMMYCLPSRLGGSGWMGSGSIPLWTRRSMHGPSRSCPISPPTSSGRRAGSPWNMRATNGTASMPRDMSPRPWQGSSTKPS